MNRREAFAALAGIPVVSTFAKADAKPDDVIVVEYDGHISKEGARVIEEKLRVAFPNNKILLLGDKFKLKVVRNAP